MSKARQISIGAIFSAISFMMVFLSMYMPLTYLWVMLGGFGIMVIMTEAGARTATLAYITVSILCFILLPNISRAITFVLLTGYYPIIKVWLDNITRGSVRRVIKLLVFLMYSIVSTWITVQILGLAVGFEQLGHLRIHILIPLAQLTIYGIAYDYVLKELKQKYVEKIRPKILSSLK